MLQTLSRAWCCIIKGGGYSSYLQLILLTNRTIFFVLHFLQAYSLPIKDLGQPLLISRPRRRVSLAKFDTMPATAEHCVFVIRIRSGRKLLVKLRNPFV